ncbi:SMP-30/gluconolactonase/LRE family protein [Nocardioides sp. WL0053]|uniref:SMP-30/gluconolactonase/LRE family protein n=1 Tax=Nocardioides jiangsuensis TaxID=2866161 RepID=A0ABS7RHM2_9ACTN|nr:SMP-30/gluconolactonase/LRE family protein [Nocardioides jiangsuensis]MBY9073568.1 SMP-30/gluconolactonase/LRE family protein [Nocardioides jiangsuensis]
MTATPAHTDRLRIVPVPGEGAEDVLVGPDSSVYTGTDDGTVWRVSADGQQVDRVGGTGGRPLGLETLPDGRILVCDARRGLLALDPGSGVVEVLTALVRGRRMTFCNNAAVGAGGEIWFSDSSRLHGIDRWKADLVENTGSGRLLRRDPDGTVDVVLEHLRFANGVALAADGSFVAVAETAGRTVVRHWLSGARAGETDHLATDLPGYPDNIALGSDGLVWVTIASPTDPVVERLMTGPMLLRRVAWRLPAKLQPQPRRTARVMALDVAGGVVHDRSFDAADFHMVTGVREHDGRVWLGSLVEPAVANFEV